MSTTSRCSSMMVDSSAGCVPVQLLGKIGDVLQACNIDSRDLPWDVTLLNELPNHQNAHVDKINRPQTRWRMDHGEVLLPSMEELLIDVTQRTRYALKSQMTQCVSKAKFRSKDGLEKLGSDRRKRIKWLKNFRVGRYNSRRALNIDMSFMSEEDRMPYQLKAERLLQQSFPHAHGRLSSPTANITPRLTSTELHHDSKPHISTSVGMKAADAGSALTLWMIWPSPEIHALHRCQTMDAIIEMTGGSFFVQMPGDIIVVPPNSPYATLALNSCYVYGHELNLDTPLDPSSVTADIVGNNMTEEEACEKRLFELKCGLRSEFHSAYVDHFIDTWREDMKYFPKGSGLMNRMIQIWDEYEKSSPDGVFGYIEGRCGIFDECEDICGLC
nr:hypothetical protein CFP56_56572 [Quercus suber]